MYSLFARQNICSHILKVHFYSRRVIFRDFSRAEMDFLAMDKSFVQEKKIVYDNLGFVLGKNLFCPRRRTRHISSIVIVE